MRIITGKAKGRRLQTLPGEGVTRPTAERVKESVFSALQFEMEGREVLDLFAGSGQMGLEALSRGAARCVFVDENRDACEIVRQNAVLTGLDALADVCKTDAFAFCHANMRPFDLAFLDPPYRAGLLPGALEAVSRFLRVGGVAVCETDDQTTLPDAVGTLVLEKERRYGKTRVWFYRQPSGKEQSE
ncbi:MAG: 16S rRNA (guanine(966)-N(2))-methyltransferase RsmD [Clostridia bacterium]|nr:16S rRNA (guanine(966)-N(2))-methyltransferase RsmD [Clostridia bacterium]